jgi:hypothetical protein
MHARPFEGYINHINYRYKNISMEVGISHCDLVRSKEAEEATERKKGPS